MSTLSQFKLGNGYPLSTSGIGYGIGSGGSVTQATDWSYPVTLNKMTGEIIVNTNTSITGSTIQFVLNNSLISAADSIVITAVDTGGSYNLTSNITSVIAISSASGGRATIKVTCNSNIGTWFPTLKIYFTVIKGATA